MKRLLLHLFLSLATIAVIFFAPNTQASPGDLYETNMEFVLRILPGASTPITFAAGLSNPKGIVFDGVGRLYVADASRGQIIRYTVPDGTSGAAFASNLASPVGLTFNAAGNLFVGEAGSGKVTKFDLVTGTPTSYATNLGEPAGLVFETNGDLFVSDFAGGKIYRITPDGTKTVFATGLSFPAGLAFDSTGVLFEADSGTGTIFKFAADGTKSSFATGLSRPFGLVFETGGTLVVSDNGNGGTFRFTPAGVRSNVFSSDFNTPQFITVEPAVHQLLNISTRGFVGTGDHFLIAGFNIGGVGPVGITVVIRALGPSLSTSGITDGLADPALEVLDASGTLIAFNNNWQDASVTQQVTNTVLQPTDMHESAVQLSLGGGAYTAIVYGFGGTTGTAIVDVYSQ